MTQGKEFDDFEEALVDQQEDESDLPVDKMGDPSQTVMFNTDWTVATIVEQIERGNILTDPEFQRRSAWDERRRSQLIESLVVGLPVPNIVLAEAKDTRGKFIVIDGKQRLTTLYDFLSKKSDVNLKLSELRIRKDLNGLTFEKLREKFSDDANFLENAPIRTVIIRNWPTDYFLYVIFDRLNSGSLPLSPQELRKALVPGPMLNYIDGFIEKNSSLIAMLGVKVPDRRMRDSEMVLRYISFERFYPNYNSDFKEFLDRSVLYFNENWDEKRHELDYILDRFLTAIDTSVGVFGEGLAFRKWNGQKFEGRVNRAIFDAVMRYFGDKEIRPAALASKDQLIERLKYLSFDSARFRRSIEQSTKTKDAIETRMTLWGEAVAEALDKKFVAGEFTLR